MNKISLKIKINFMITTTMNFQEIQQISNKNPYQLIIINIILIIKFKTRMMKKRKTQHCFLNSEYELFSMTKLFQMKKEL